MKRTLLVPALLLVMAACRAGTDADLAAAEIVTEPPSLQELANAEYSGIEESAVRLVDGQWQGQPYAEGGASRPSVGLAKGFGLYGDVDGDGEAEAIVLLWTSSGGSGTFDYIAVVDRGADGKAVNTGTAPLGDRVKVQSAEVVDGQLVFEVVQAGPNDAMCCPGQRVRRTFALKDSGLTEISSEDLGRVSPTGPEGSE